MTESALRYTNDWGQLVITHELTHIFHLERTRGIWSVAQKIFGRAATLFPNLYDPSWLTEGLAVYEESKLTGAGRIEGSEHRMIARAASIDGTYQSIGTLSLGQGRYPFGESAYAFGSLFVDYLAATQGDSALRKFVDKSAANVIPYLIDIPARQGLGISFTRAWKHFTDSVNRSIAVPDRPPLCRRPLAAAHWRDAACFTTSSIHAGSPIPDRSSTSGTPGRDVESAYRIDEHGRRTRVGRRNSQSANVLLADGSLLYAQLDFVNPYQLRSDLWIQRGRREIQLTHGQRLENPDARADGEIVAVQVIPGATRLVRVSRDGRRITPITSGTYDEQWTEPRWSHHGDRIAAVRWRRGNLSQIVILDSLGGHVDVVASAHSIQATPSWAPGDAGLFYSSDLSGSAQAIYVPLGAESAGPRASFTIGRAQTGRFEPEPSPLGDRLASTLFRSDGYHLGVSQCCDPSRDGWTPAGPPPLVEAPSSTTAPIVVDSSPARPYRAWRTFVPRYWLPIADQGIDGGYRIGATTSGVDVLGRHFVSASLEVPTNHTGVTGNFTYRYAGLGLPVLQVDASQDWQSLGGVFSRIPPRPLVGEIFRRTLTGDVLATWTRQRFRNVLQGTAGFELEYRTHTATPSDTLLAAVDTTGIYGNLVFPTLIAGISFANTQRPPFSISPEDGIAAAVTLRERTRSGANSTGGASGSAVGITALYRSLNLPGFSHHVIALRGAAGWSDERAADYFSVGGVNGQTFEVIPGYVVGEGSTTFPVRGFASSTLIGTRAYTASAEYRVPLALIGRAPSDLPFFLDRTSLSLFGDYGTAWCPTIAIGREVCNRISEAPRLAIASVGAELNVNLGVLSWDSPYRFRLGVAHPTLNAAEFARGSAQIYFATGVAF